MLHFKKDKIFKKDVVYDPSKQEAVMRCSICTGEQVAGFRDYEGGIFHEVMLIRSPQDLQEFQNRYSVDKVKKIY